ncbi:hypothetical protein QBC42DRAFT_328513 [Cladorrhinum samala]|uniref:Uncharacterized protein n=1 Tax=Cladorrhinum samala TaxID=585594 RepID=A0AAV9HMA5_9PEZI|nr:hypothetical protein QBC42DRAFT_328513 [Cladorrhinum samala]
MPPKYHRTASAHKHDLLVSLRKNEFYHLPEFYIRARAWYKAEIDRHLSAVSPASDHSSAAEQARPAVRHHPGVPPSDSPTTRRIQPPRSAKRLAAPPSDLATTKRSRRSDNRDGGIINAQKTGDYTLPSKQFERFLALQRDDPSSGDGDQLVLPPPTAGAERRRRSLRDRDLRVASSPVLPGIHVAYCMLGLEDVVEFKVLELLKSNLSSHNGANDPTKKAEEGGRKCLLELRKYKYKQRFKPAWGVEEPGEEWRLNRDRPSPDNDPGDYAGLMIEEEGEKLATTTGSGTGTPVSSVVLAKKAGNVRDLKVLVELSREERSRTGTPAPVAEMQLSPTLGRWQLDGVGDMGGGKSKRKRMKVESLDGKIVETELGLRFAVDLCEAIEGRRVKDGVKILMV